MELDPKRVAGLAISRGGPTSHVAILAAAMNIPAVVALGPRVLSIEDGALVILDGDEGRLQVAPEAGEIAAAQTRLVERRHAPCRAPRPPPGAVPHGRRDAHRGVRQSRRGRRGHAGGRERRRGLRPPAHRVPVHGARRPRRTRTSSSPPIRPSPTALDGRPLVIRTLDIGADKPVAYLPLPPRRTRRWACAACASACAWPELLRTQLRAILRVQPAGQAQIMLPMVASLGELQRRRGRSSPSSLPSWASRCRSSA